MAKSEVEAEKPESETAEPRGFGEHTRGLASEYAHEQGWGLDEEERTKQDTAPQNIDGGTDYEYGAQDFGDEPVNTAIPPDAQGSHAEQGIRQYREGERTMAEQAAVPEKTQEKTHGDKLEHAVNDALSKGTGLAQDPSGKSSEREPAQEPLK